MSKVPVGELSQAEVEELLVTYSAMIIADTESADNITKLIKAAGGKVEAYWPKMFCAMLEGKDLAAYIKVAGTPGAGGGGGAAPAAAAAGGGGGGAAAEKAP